MLQTGYSPQHGLDYVVDETGQRRILACLPPRPDRGGLMAWSEAMPVIPRSQWRNTNHKAFYAPILDQGQHGSCVGHGSVTTFQRAWAMAGGTQKDFSACYIYGNINGGRDAGAIISDALTCLQQKGVCLLSTVPEGMIYRSQFPASADQEAAHAKVAKAYHCQSFDDMGSALMMGFMLCYGIRVGGSFQAAHFDSNGIAPIAGGMGNHCMAGVDLKILADGTATVLNQNSWGAWGADGFCYLVEGHFFNGSNDPDVFAVQCPVPDSDEAADNIPPVIHTA